MKCGKRNVIIYDRVGNMWESNKSIKEAFGKIKVKIEEKE